MPTDIHALLPLMLVPLIVWICVWAYLWNLDGKIKRLKEDMGRLDESEGEDL